MDLSSVSSILDFLGSSTSALSPLVIGVGAIAVMSLACCGFAMRAAHRASNSLSEAQAILRETKDRGVEMRQLAAQTERASLRLTEHRSNESLSERIQSVRVDDGSSPGTDSEIDNGGDAGETMSDANLADEKASDQEEAPELSNEEAATEDSLSNAAKAASVPSSLLRGILRRR